MNERMRAGSLLQPWSPVSAPTITPTSGRRIAAEIRNALAYAALASRPGRKKSSARPLRVAMNAAKPIPTSP
jgi:hypothetical protein